MILQGLGGNLILQGFGPGSGVVVPEVPLPTLVVEDGTGKWDAEAFCTVTYADDYHLRRGGPTIWSGLSTAKKEAALRRATDYMEEEFRARWLGSRAKIDQALSWPRWDVEHVDYRLFGSQWTAHVGWDRVPDIVKKANAQLALKAASGPLSNDTGRLKQSAKIGPISVTYANSATNQNTVFTAVENTLRPLLKDFARPGEAHSVRLERG